MANAFDGQQWNIDTAGVIIFEPVNVKSVEWQGTGLTAGTDELIILDPVTGIALYRSKATGTTVVEYRLIEQWWYNGFEVDTLDGGELIVRLQ